MSGFIHINMIFPHGQFHGFQQGKFYTVPKLHPGRDDGSLWFHPGGWRSFC